MVFHIIENNLRENLGHFLNCTTGLRLAALQAGSQVSVYGHRRASSAVIRECGAVPLFEHLSWRGSNSRDPITAMKFYGEAFFRNCQQIGSIAPDDLILVATALQNQVFGMAKFLGTLPVKQKPYLALNFHWPPASENPNQIKACSMAFDALRHAAVKDKVIITGATRGIVDTLKQLAQDLPVKLAPLPLYYGQSKPPAKSLKEASPVAAFMGRPLRRKGAPSINKLIGQLNRAAPQLRFIVQATVKTPQLFMLMFNRRVKLQLGGLSQEDYYTQLRSANLFILPYSLEHYADRTSGVFADCAAFGGIAIVPAGTWMAGQIEDKHAAGWIYAPHSPKGIQKAVLEALRDHRRLQQQAQACTSYWWRHQSANAYWEKITQFFGLK